MGIISTIAKGASNIGQKMFGKNKKPPAQVISHTVDGNGNPTSTTYDRIPDKTTSQKLREFNKKIDEKMREEHPPAEPKEDGVGLKQKMFGTETPSTPTTWGGRHVGEVAGDILRGVKKGVQNVGKTASSGYNKAKEGYIKAEPERNYLQFMSGIKIAKKTNVFKGKNFVGGKKRGRKTKEEKKAMRKEELYQRNVVARLKKGQTNQGLGSTFGNFDLPMGMSFSNSESISAKPFVRKTDNPYDINAHFNKARIKL